jgi:hypothetical protein
MNRESIYEKGRFSFEWTIFEARIRLSSNNWKVFMLV